MAGHALQPVEESDLPELLPLMRGYCDFYEVATPDEELLAVSRGLIADHAGEGLQLLARSTENGEAIGFATIFWSWSTLSGSRIGVMNDLFVAREARGSGVAEALILECVQRCRQRGGVKSLQWQTAKDNARAQALYDRVGGKREEWLDYSLEVG